MAKISYFIGGVALTVLLGVLFWPGRTTRLTDENNKPAATASAEDPGHVELSPEALKAANIQTAEAEKRDATSLIAVTGTVEANQEKIQQITPLVSGRVERVNVVLGDRVAQGAVLAVISSPEVAEMHGNLHQAETRLRLADQTLERVLRTENRAGVLQSKARLDEAEANLRRTQRLTDLGAAAGKDLISAQTAYTSAKADYEYQNNISVNREVQEARSAVETAQAEIDHLRNTLASLGVTIIEGETRRLSHDTSIVTLVAPGAGTVTERLVNAGAGIEAGKPLFTIADTSTLWVIANVPEGQISALNVGTRAEILHSELGPNARAGRVAYIDPNLNEETRTGRVRVEIHNPEGRLKAGMFVDVRFQAAAEHRNGKVVASVVVPDEAVQRIGERAIVFIPSAEKPGQFEVRDVQLGEPMGAMHQIMVGLQARDRVVTKGSFVLKTQLLKGQLGDE
jgi:cobalt-zinc-cadmium efflux system membrane fusion protein